MVLWGRLFLARDSMQRVQWRGLLPKALDTSAEYLRSGALKALAHSIIRLAYS